MEIEDLLVRQNENAYGSDYKNHLFEQYKMFVESQENISERRQKTNEFFLGLNTAAFATLGIADGRFSNGGALPFLVGLAGLVVCYFWYNIIKSYKNISTGKFAVIHAIETKLPLALYHTEWEVLGQGKDKKKYWPFSHIEMKVPWIFGIAYGLVVVGTLFS